MKMELATKPTAHTITEAGNAVLHIERHRDRRVLSLGGTKRERFEAELAEHPEWPDNVCSHWMHEHESILLRKID
jgi:hypothetical protein